MRPKQSLVRGNSIELSAEKASATDLSAKRDDQNRVLFSGEVAIGNAVANSDDQLIHDLELVIDEMKKERIALIKQTKQQSEPTLGEQTELITSWWEAII